MLKIFHYPKPGSGCKVLEPGLLGLGFSVWQTVNQLEYSNSSCGGGVFQALGEPQIPPKRRLSPKPAVEAMEVARVKKFKAPMCSKR